MHASGQNSPLGRGGGGGGGDSIAVIVSAIYTINSAVQVQVLLFGDCAFSWHRLWGTYNHGVLFNEVKYMVYNSMHNNL